MMGSLWQQLPDVSQARKTPNQWLTALLRRNAHCDYLRRFGSPRTEAAFRNQVPVIHYEDLKPYVEQLGEGKSHVLFDGRPVAYEWTGGSSGGRKLIPYSAVGLRDIQHSLVPWLAHTARRHKLSGSVYFATSPVTRKPAFYGNRPIGLPDGAYLGDAVGRLLLQHTAVPFAMAGIADVDQWREATLGYLKAARDLELISVWSPTFLLRLCADVGDTRRYWPHLKAISCWTSGPAQHYVAALSRLFPQAVIEAKGLMSTEAVTTVPDPDGRLRLVPHGYFEFRQGDQYLGASALVTGDEYEVILTTASGLYRYASGDRVRCAEADLMGRPVLEFLGRDALSCDLVGEKLTDAFVAHCLGSLEGFAMLVPDVQNPGYVLISGRPRSSAWLNALETRLRHNPQYDYALRLGQLQPLRQLVCQQPFALVERVMLRNGVRLGDIKPTALRADDFWLPMFEELT